MPRYNDTILNYYNDNSHIGSFNIKNKNIGTGIVGSPSCGDVMKLQIKIKKESKTNTERIIDAKILVFGCGSAKASSSYVAQQLIGKTIQEAKQIKNTDIAKYLGLPKIKLHCSILAEDAIKKAIEDYSSKNNKKNNKKNDKKINKKRNSNESHSDDHDINYYNNTAHNELNISITDNAIDFVKKNLLKIKKNIKGIELYLVEGHCGLMYKVRYLEDSNNTENYVYREKNGLKIYVKKSEWQILNGTIIEYKEDSLKRGLIFKNPRETGRCHCGMNFFTADKQNTNSEGKNS